MDHLRWSLVRGKVELGLTWGGGGVGGATPPRKVLNLRLTEVGFQAF